LWSHIISTLYVEGITAKIFVIPDECPDLIGANIRDLDMLPPGSRLSARFRTGLPAGMTNYWFDDFSSPPPQPFAANHATNTPHPKLDLGPRVFFDGWVLTFVRMRRIYINILIPRRGKL